MRCIKGSLCVIITLTLVACSSSKTYEESKRSYHPDTENSFKRIKYKEGFPTRYLAHETKSQLYNILQKEVPSKDYVGYIKYKIKDGDVFPNIYIDHTIVSFFKNGSFSSYWELEDESGYIVVGGYNETESLKPTPQSRMSQKQKKTELDAWLIKINSIEYQELQRQKQEEFQRKEEELYEEIRRKDKAKRKAVRDLIIYGGAALLGV